MMRTTAVLMAVARFEFTSLIPIFARIEVSAAKTEERIANKSHILHSSMNSDSLVFVYIHYTSIT